jgi:putative glutamine amidotransferase
VKHSRRIGITQRMIEVSPHGEFRDSLATDWYPFLRALDMPWITLPNDVGAALDSARHFDLGGLILSGGDDPGVFPRRDDTEFALLDWALGKNIPIVGICRGFQVLCRHMGGTLAPVDPSIHRRKRHIVLFADGISREVNSYHNIAPSALPPGLTLLARCAIDGSPEAASGKNLLGLLWHPEREAKPAPEDVLFLKTFLTEA